VRQHLEVLRGHEALADQRPAMPAIVLGDVEHQHRVARMSPDDEQVTGPQLRAWHPAGRVGQRCSTGPREHDVEVRPERPVRIIGSGARDHLT
jgi:hypothetical protein